MSHPYIAFDPLGLVNGETLQAVNIAFHVPGHAHRLLREHGLPSLPEAGEWYPLQGWLNLLGELEEGYGGQTVYAVGLQIASCSNWPSNIIHLVDALASLDQACCSNIESTPMGYYRSVRLSAKSVRVVCHTPTPPDFEYGIITGLARKFKPPGSLRIRVEKEALPANSERLLKQFLITWS
jgi:hypothetical protein